MSKILIVDDERPIRRALARLLTRIDCDVVAAEDGIEARAKLVETPFDLVITDLFMPRADGFTVLRSVRELQPALPVVVLTGHGSAADCVRAMRAGATDFMSKPVQPADLQHVVRGALQRRASEGDRAFLHAALMCESPGLRTLLDQIEQVVDTDAVVLLVGERYDGKRAIARFLHATSHPPREPFIEVDCDSVAPERLESELFGGETTPGRLSSADGGTLFLSHTGNVAPALRDRILSRLAAHRRPERGGNAPVDVRVVVDVVLAAEGDRDPGSVLGTLRNVLGAVVIEVPSIREHGEELPSLIAYLVGVSELRLSRHPRS